jgi:ATP synthase protein I
VPETKASNSMEDYYKLQQLLLKYSLLLMVLLFPLVCFFYSVNIAFNYLLGASVGILYLRILFKDVEKIGVGKGRVGSKGLLIFSGLIIVACRWQHLHVIPVFLGFLTYKAAIMIYMFKSLMPQSQS